LVYVKKVHITNQMNLFIDVQNLLIVSHMKHHCINNNPKLVQQLFFQYNLRKLVPE